MDRIRKISILGSTGSIGMQTLDVVRSSGVYKVSALACAGNIERLAGQIAEFGPEYAAVAHCDDAERLALEFPATHFFYGSEGLARMAEEAEDDILLNSVVGIAGLEPTYRALLAGKQIALANKETLVAGGSLIMKTAAEKGITILPVDSEHSAVFQCLQGSDRRSLRRIILTASGGPFRGMNLQQMRGVTVEQALAHPSWKMGRKITIDSATMMNKGFEVIEARWLFDAEPAMIDVLVHPQSIVHSMVEFADHAVIAQLGIPDMRIPIAYALSYPERLPSECGSLDLAQVAGLTFEKPDPDTFVCLKLAYEALAAGGTCCTELNGANEICVAAFLNGKIRFTDIAEVLGRIVAEYAGGFADDLDGVLAADARARARAGELISQLNLN